MQDIASTDPAFTLAGGHTTIKMSYTNSVGNLIKVTAYVCTQCHGGAITNFDDTGTRYVGYGVIGQGDPDGRFRFWMNQLQSMLLPPAHLSGESRQLYRGRPGQGCVIVPNGPDQLAHEIPAGRLQP